MPGCEHGTIGLARQLGHLLPLCTISLISTGLTSPVVPYVFMSFFARRYSDDPGSIHCEDQMKSPACQSAVLDVAKVQTVLSVLTPTIQLLLMPAVGRLSDCFGRRRMLLLGYGISSIFLTLMICNIFFGTSLYYCLVFAPFASGSTVQMILCAATNDRLEGPSRAAGLGLLTATALIGEMLGLALGFSVTLKTAFVLAAVFAAACFLYLALLLPETLAPEQRHAFKMEELMPGVSLQILWRNKLLGRLALIIFVSAFIDQGWLAALPLYFQRTLAWEAEDTYLTTIVQNVSVVLWLALAFQPIVSAVGEVGALAFSRCSTTIFVSLLMMATGKGQVKALIFTLGGPMEFPLLAVSGLKSRLVGEDEQGVMQAGLTAGYAAFSGLGSLIAGVMFQSMLKPDADKTVFRNVFLSISLTLGALLLAMILSMAFYMRKLASDNDPIVVTAAGWKSEEAAPLAQAASSSLESGLPAESHLRKTYETM